MTYPTVNLLKKNEQRFQGAVSRKFTFVSAVVAPILLIAILSGIKLIQYGGVQTELSSSRGIWKDLEPRLALYKDENKGLAVNRNALDLFEGWKSSQPELVKLLNDIQQTVPPEIQFTRFSVRSAPASANYTTVAEMQLIFELVIEGKSQGEHAENNVINLRKNLLACEQIGATFNSLKLASMRQSKGRSGESIREFKLEGATAVEAAQ